MARAPMYGFIINQAIHRSTSHTLEDGSYIGALILEGVFQRIGTIIHSLFVMHYYVYRTLFTVVGYRPDIFWTFNSSNSFRSS